MGVVNWPLPRLGSRIGPVESTISDDSSLGACWAMEGSTGRVTIELPLAVTVESVSLEHVSRLVTLEGYSAPALFQVGVSSNVDIGVGVGVGVGGYACMVPGRPAIFLVPLTGPLSYQPRDFDNTIHGPVRPSSEPMND